jgi:hypothetical protein
VRSKKRKGQQTMVEKQSGENQTNEGNAEGFPMRDFPLYFKAIATKEA